MTHFAIYQEDTGVTLWEGEAASHDYAVASYEVEGISADWSGIVVAEWSPKDDTYIRREYAADYAA